MARLFKKMFISSGDIVINLWCTYREGCTNTWICFAGFVMEVEKECPYLAFGFKPPLGLKLTASVSCLITPLVIHLVLCLGGCSSLCVCGDASDNFYWRVLHDYFLWPFPTLSIVSPHFDHYHTTIVCWHFLGDHTSSRFLCIPNISDWYTWCRYHQVFGVGVSTQSGGPPSGTVVLQL